MDGPDQRIEIVARLLDRPIFIAGRGRSGTSLLMRLFDGHPQIFSTPGESRVFTEIVPELRRSGDREAAAAGIALRFPIGRNQIDPTLDERVEALDIASPTLAREIFRIGLERWSRKRNPGDAIAFLEKTPKNEEHLRSLFENFPAARVVYLLRDPRAVYISNRRSEIYRIEPAFAAMQWVKSVRNVLKQFIKPEFGSRIHVVRFENLVEDPEGTLARLCTFLEIEWFDSLTSPTVRGRPWTGNSYAPEKLTPDGIASHKAEEWRGEITALEDETITAIAWSEMALLGYAATAGRRKSAAEQTQALRLNAS
jgi:PAS domain-containing protein